MELLITLAGIALAFVLWVVSPESLRRSLRHLFVRVFRSDPAAAVEPDMAMFDGRVEMLTESLLNHPADAARKKQFYEAEGPLNWDIIAAQADVERDQQGDLIEQLSERADSLRFVCVLGQSGSGKSTLAWRVAAELYRRHQALVVHVKGWEAPEVWYRMPAFCSAVRRPVFVLADDLFRDAEVRTALQQLSPWLPLTVLATSQTHEYRPGRLNGRLIPIPLREVSSQEKARVLHRLGQDPRDFGTYQSARLKAADDFLVLMAELTFGKGFQVIVQESLDNLARRHQAVYRAYEYLCLAYSYGIAVPITLLQRLDAQGGFYDLPNREGARGLIFYDDGRPDCLRPGHPRRAELASKLFQRNRPAAHVLEELVKAADASVPLHRRFVTQLLRILTVRGVEVVGEVLPRIQDEIAACVRQSSISELGTWRALYLSLDQPAEAERLMDAALAREPVDSADANVVRGLYRERGRERDALPVLERWIQTHVEWGGAGPAYLGLVEKYGNESSLERAIANTTTWLATHPDDNYVRTPYLGLVERKGTPDQTERVLKETAAWLATHPDDSALRSAYLGLVERKGTVDQTETFLKETAVWLAKHPDDTTVRTVYLGFVERKGTTDQTERVLRENAVWLAKHPDDGAVRTAYLGLVERNGTADQTERVLRETAAWLATHPDDNYVRTAYLGLVERNGTADQTERVLKETAVWLAKHPDDSAVRTAYLGLVERNGTADQTERVLKETAAWLRAHPNATDVWSRFLSYLLAFSRLDDARTLAEEIVTIHSANANLVMHYLALMQDRLEEGRITDLYVSLMRTFPRASAIRMSWARWLITVNRRDEAEKVFKALTAEHPRSFNAPYAYGRLLLGMERYEEAANHFRQVLKIHRGHAMAHDGLATALQGLARRAEDLNDDSEATRLLLTAERELRSAIYWAGVGQDRQAKFFTNLGWFYVGRKRWNDAHSAFDQAANEAPDYFGNYWGKGRSLVGLKQWRDAESALRKAREKAADSLGPPASDDIQQLIHQCEAALTSDPQEA